MKHELNIPEAVVHAAATILQQYVPEITPRYLKAAILQYHYTGDAAETKAIVKRKLTRTELPDPRYFADNPSSLHPCRLSENGEDRSAPDPD